MPSTSASSHKGTHGSRKPARSKKRPSAASKRLKVDHAPEDSQGGVPQNVGLCELERLPLELVAEVLSHASSPRDILALARCSKYFCRTLVNNPGTDFIWKQARARSYPTPIPDPTPNFTEASYAAFLFDKGTCEVCETKIAGGYTSFALRLRLCSKLLCKQKWVRNNAISDNSLPPRYIELSQWVPRTEPEELGPTDPIIIAMLGGPSCYHRLSDWNEAVDEFNKAALDEATRMAYLEKKVKSCARVATMAEHAKELKKWAEDRRAKIEAIKKYNDTKIAAIAHREGWNVQDMQRSPSFSTLLRIKNLSLVILLDQDIEIIRPELEAQIIQSQGQRERSDAEKGYQKRRRDVEAYYNRIRSAEPAKIMPTLQEFRKLPTVQLMEKNDSRITGIAKDLQHITVKSLLLHDLEIWEKDTQERLAETLGYKGWKSASSLKLHPTQRLTARFRCTRCDAAFPAGRFDDRGFTLSETCLHCCKPNNRKEKSKGVWSTELFVGDQKAIQACQQILDQLGVASDDKASFAAVEKLGVRIQCLSCTVPILMTFPMMLSHCKRHESVRFAVLSPDEAAQLSSELVHVGARTLVMQAGNLEKLLREGKIYSCRYCLLATRQEDKPLEGGEAAASGSQSSEGQSPGEIQDASTEEIPNPPGSSSSREKSSDKEKGKKPRYLDKGSKTTFSFDGLRSHAKEKHGITWIGDEDIICSGLSGLQSSLFDELLGW